MFLKSVKARGFKSFARPVEFAFEPGITVIVGPNGSGKSNIADAVLWAMGEQSPSSVRGSTMQDVIFSGSDKLSASGLAEVEILLDNSSGLLPIEYSEVLISRRLSRDGDGEYFINKTGCRLIDVGELLSDAGLGRDSHSIIGQGKVDAVLESKPHERRAHIEEAAGLGKFKKRRHRAERKLEAVRRNLERLADVEEEVKTNLRPLKRQATAAERSERLDRKIAMARARMIKGKLAEINRELERAKSESRQAGALRQQIEKQLAEAAEERRRTEELLANSLKEHKQLAARFYGLKSQQEGIAQRSESVRQRRAMLAQADKRARARMGNLEGQIERATSELERARSEQRQGSARLRTVETELSGAEAELARVDEEVARHRRVSEERSRKLGELGALRDRSRHQVDFLSQRKQKLAADAERASRELQAIRSQYADLDGQLQQERENLAGGRDELSQAELELKAANSEFTEIRNKREEAASDLRSVSEELRIAKARLTFIGDSDRDRAGLPAAAKSLTQEGGVRAIVDLLEVEPGYEQAVSAVMGRMLFALAVDDMDEAGEMLAKVRSGDLGSVEFLLPGEDLDESRSLEPGDGDRLVDHVTIPGGWRGHLAGFLAGFRVVDDISAAQAQAGQTYRTGDWVTRDGVLYQSGRRMLSYREATPSSVVLKHRNERKQLEDSLNQAQADHRRLEERLQDMNRRRVSLEGQCRDAEERHRQLTDDLVDNEAGIAALERKRKVLQQEIELKTAGREHFQAEESKVDEEHRQALEKLNAAERTLAEISEDDGGSAQVEAVAAMKGKAELEQQVTELKISAARVREREKVAEHTIERVSPALDRLRADLGNARFQQAAFRCFDPVCGRLLAALESLGSVFEEVVGQVASELKQAEDQSERRSAGLRELSRAEAQLQQKLSRASDTTTDCEVGLAKLRDQAGEQDAQLATIVESFPDDGIVELEPTPAAELEEAQSQIERMLRRREQIGPINPLAQEEYDEMLERQRFLSEQRQDLEKSMAELGSLIRELTERIESTFNATFEAVQKNFSEVVASLFPGGEGRLTNVEAEEDSEAAEGAAVEAQGLNIDRRGIEISVKPARKAVRSLSLLSGGERSLAAIAFLFSIFLARPAPFYILDEVEAALDDSNIGRLLNMLRRFQDRTQFIVITHQKRTMEVADVLYGVSMGADGTSKVLSRRMDSTDSDDSPEGELEPEPAAIAG